MYVHLTDFSQYTIFFSHGNAVDLGQMASFYVALGTRISCNIFSYDYSGYGASNGEFYLIFILPNIYLDLIVE